MIDCKRQLFGATWLKLASLAALAVAAGCGEDGLSPTEELPATAAPAADSVPTDSTLLPVDSTSLPLDSTVLIPDSAGITTATALAVGTQPGIVFGSWFMDPSQLTSVHNGTVKGGGLIPTNILSFLSGARAKGGRVVMKLCMGSDSYVKNADGTFSFTKWKALIDRYRTTNFGPYIADGTILGHLLIDEPSMARRWGGKAISPATLEAMAAYSKQIWPGMTTFVRVSAVWLASSLVTYRHLDAAWLQYARGKGDVVKVVTTEVAAAKSKRLGLVVGMNVLDGGDGSSGIRGTYGNAYAMSASEIRTYGTALLNQSYVCGFYNWTYNYFGPTYYNRSDIKSAFGALSTKARSHVRTSCRQ
jgi:hypothetical protein